MAADNHRDPEKERRPRLGSCRSLPAAVGEDEEAEELGNEGR